jgi:CRISPR-associated endonuclease/helicase Cas3
MTTDTSIEQLYRRCLDREPFAYQRKLAVDGLPEVLDVPTGCGKTAAVMMGWLYRRCLHPDLAVRVATPRRLVWCTPLRTLTEQTAAQARQWLSNAGLGGLVAVHELVGGRPPLADWRLHLDENAILVATLDMALSRALNRGYGLSLHAWPVDFALVNNDCHWVFDEVQLMGPALVTSRQLHGLRDSMGTAGPTGGTWMSATLHEAGLRTVDSPDSATVFRLNDLPPDEALNARRAAEKRLVCRMVEDPKRFAKGLAEVAAAEHRAGTLSVVVVNTVELAQESYRLLVKALPDVDIVLLHSRFRPGDRRSALERALSDPGPGRIVVSTQVIEAGVDMSATTMITECAPWSSLVQRAGRCNRWGEVEDARFVVVESPAKGPYEAADVEQAWVECRSLDGAIVTPEDLAARSVHETVGVHPALRRADLLDLFDTAADLSGNHVDVGRFIRDSDDLDVSIAWRDVGTAGLDDRPRAAAPEELCSVPIGKARELLNRHSGPGSRAWSFLAQPSARHPVAGWQPIDAADLRPGMTLLLDVSAGFYSSELGFSLLAKDAVEPIEPSVPATEGQGRDDGAVVAEALSDDLAPDDDPLSVGYSAPVLLSTHLLDAEAAAADLCDALGSPDHVAAAVKQAARLHDLGKAHGIWQAAAHDGEVETGQVLAKSGRRGRLRYGRPGFRHELVSALAVVAQPELAGDCDPDLVAYLVGAHHGRARVSLPVWASDGANGDEVPGRVERRVLGVVHGDSLDAVDLGGGLRSSPMTLSLDIATLGLDADGNRSWVDRASRLVEREGVFVLAWMETLVRIADWRASAAPGAHAPGGAAGAARAGGGVA